jgi:hypothetical protein
MHSVRGQRASLVPTIAAPHLFVAYIGDGCYRFLDERILDIAIEAWLDRIRIS